MKINKIAIPLMLNSISSTIINFFEYTEAAQMHCTPIVGLKT